MPQETSNIPNGMFSATTSTLPDFRNLGVLLRILIAVHILGILTVLISEPDPGRWPAAMLAFSILLEPTLLLSLLLMAMLARRLTTLPNVQAWLGILVLIQSSLLLATLLPAVDDKLQLRPMLWAAGAMLVIGRWLHLLHQSRSPALAEARLMALTARIRPHFLFNSLNGILGIIRSDPRRAETALEELSDLFRALMQDPRELVPLSTEISLCRQYVELERLRLGERMRVSWDIDQCPPDALMPPLMLQPLLENAVYHGIEPTSEPGEIKIKLSHNGSSIVIAMSSPYETPSYESFHNRSAGNQMALTNIRERLMLFYDLAADLDAEVCDGRYTVRIVLPYRKCIA